MERALNGRKENNARLSATETDWVRGRALARTGEMTLTLANPGTEERAGLIAVSTSLVCPATGVSLNMTQSEEYTRKTAKEDLRGDLSLKERGDSQVVGDCKQALSAATPSKGEVSRGGQALDWYECRASEPEAFTILSIEGGSRQGTPTRVGSQTLLVTLQFSQGEGTT